MDPDKIRESLARFQQSKSQLKRHAAQDPVSAAERIHTLERDNEALRAELRRLQTERLLTVEASSTPPRLTDTPEG